MGDTNWFQGALTVEGWLAKIILWIDLHYDIRTFLNPKFTTWQNFKSDWYLKPLTHHKIFSRLAAVTGGGGGYPVAEPEPGNLSSFLLETWGLNLKNWQNVCSSKKRKLFPSEYQQKGWHFDWKNFILKQCQAQFQPNLLQSQFFLKIHILCF